jgi:hypothetical protein
LKDRQLIENAAISAGPDAEGFTTFLARFSDYETSLYVRERLAHGQRISRLHCYDVCNQLDLINAAFSGEQGLKRAIFEVVLQGFGDERKRQRNRRPCKLIEEFRGKTGQGHALNVG